jgi:starch synthase (maltosyl-transferring)
MSTNGPQAIPLEGRNRAVIENVSPQIDNGRYAIKRTLGEKVVIEADIFADGHDALAAVIKYRAPDKVDWLETPMRPLANDRWRGEFIVTQLGSYSYTIEAWIDHFQTWRQDLGKKLRAGQKVNSELRMGARLLETAAGPARADEATTLRRWAKELWTMAAEELMPSLVHRALDEGLAKLMSRQPGRPYAATYTPELRVTVDPVRARFSSWYEIFPRSCGKSGRHGTFQDCAAQLPRIAAMGFDVLYLPPIHPIGRAFRKGKNNSPVCQPGEPGSPWGIGSAEGGHKTVHRELGTLEDFGHLVQQARVHGIEVALDIALQCSPDHPYVREHPEWFRHRPDGSIQYAENPPKKYQDIVPFDFECDAWESLWLELKSIFEFWMEQGVRVFRVDNPHTKALPFWEWCLADLKQQDAELVFLAEAFTRPKLMYHLAKLGFTQSYNYFPWRNGKDELIEYFTELIQTDVVEFFRPNLWPNTPDILPEYLQTGGRAAFIVRLILAATLGANYGVYGPAFELGEATPREEGSEEYLNSEKYEIRQWDFAAAGSLQDLITRVNRIRRDNPALQSAQHLRFHRIDNDQLLAYTKSAPDGSDTLLMAVNLDPHHAHSGWLEWPVEEFHLNTDQTYQMHDLLTGARFLWKGARNYLELNPQYAPAHILRVRQRVRTERDFDYFL